jgi:hypothetical protein
LGVWEVQPKSGIGIRVGTKAPEELATVIKRQRQMDDDLSAHSVLQK